MRDFGMIDSDTARDAKGFEVLPDEQIAEIEEKFREQMAKRNSGASRVRARSLLEYSDEPIIGAFPSGESAGSARLSAPVSDDLLACDNDATICPQTVSEELLEIDAECEYIVPAALRKQVDDRKKELSIRAVLKLTPGMCRALDSIGCNTIGDLLDTEAKAFVSMKGMSLGKLGSLRREFERWLKCAAGDNVATSEVTLGSGETLIAFSPEMHIPPLLLGSKITKAMRLTPCIYSALEKLGCKEVGDLLQVKTDDFLKCDGVGKGAVSRIRKAFIKLLSGDLENPVAPVASVASEVRALVGERYSFEAQLPCPVELTRLGHPNFIPLAIVGDKSKGDSSKPNAIEPTGAPLWMSRIRLSWLISACDSNGFDTRTVGDAVAGENAGESYDDVNSAVSALDSLWSLAGQADNAEELIAQCLVDSDSRIKAKSVTVFLQREATVPQKTLKEVADEQGVTRERVRQLDAKISRFLDLRASRRFFPVRLVVLASAFDLGGYGSVADLSAALEDAKMPFGGSMLAFAAVSPDIAIDRTGKTFSLKEHPCQNCAALETRVQQIKDAKELVGIEEFYCSVGCDRCMLRPSAAWLENCFAGIGTDGERIGSIENPSTPSMKHPRKSERAIVRAIMYEAPGALSYDEIIEEYQLRTGKPMSRVRASSNVGALEECFLWGRGTYIHESKVSIPADLLYRISCWICDQFRERRIPILGIGGIFEQYESELSAAGIPTQHALYSLLRRANDARLELREYPWVCDSQTIGERTSFAKYFYWILEQNNGFITDAHAEAIASRAMAQSFALGGLAEYSPFLINANGGWYDVEAAEFDMEGVANLARDIAAQMRENDIVSTVKVFEDNKERCMSYGVKSHDILFYLINMMEDDLPVEATRRPHLVKSSHKGLSVLGAIRMYIKDSTCPVSLEKLYEEFVTKRKLNRSGICASVIVGDDIVEIGKGVFWSLSKMHIDDEYISAFDGAVANATSCSHKIADLYYARQELFPSFEALPSPVDMRWSEELFAVVFSKSHRFKLLGEGNACLIDTQENPDVVNAETFYHALLENEFYGWSTFESFADYCNSRSIRGNLGPEFFDAFDTIRADEYSIEAL